MGKGSGASGARGGASGGASSSSSLRRNLTPAEIKAEEKKIDRQGFQAQGNGMWEFPTNPTTGIGAQILDETDSSAGDYGRMKAYSVVTWGREPGMVSDRNYFGSLNDAKAAAREEMKGWLPSVTVRR